MNKYLRRHTHGSTHKASPVQDSIERYLSEKTVTSEVIDQYGGLLEYCTQQLVDRPRIYTMVVATQSGNVTNAGELP